MGPKFMQYNLNIEQKTSTKKALLKMFRFMTGEKRNLVIAFVVMALNSAISMLTPYLIGYTIDHYIQTKLYQGLLTFTGILLGLYIISALRPPVLLSVAAFFFFTTGEIS
jgi:ATP-binding cassette subfamily B protein